LIWTPNKNNPNFHTIKMFLLSPTRNTAPQLNEIIMCKWMTMKCPEILDSRRYQIFWEVVGLERGPLSLVITTEELLERKSSGSGLEIREHVRRDSSRWPRGTLYPQNLVLTSPTSGGISAVIVRSQTQATEFLIMHLWKIHNVFINVRLSACFTMCERVMALGIMPQIISIPEWQGERWNMHAGVAGK
jgi:hypothetical protein